MRKLILCLALVAMCAFAQTSNYPGSLDTDVTLFVTGDNVQSTLANAMAAGDNTAFVTDSGAGFLANMIVTICDASSKGKCTAWEHMHVTGVSGNALSLVRGAAGTSARSHVKGATISVAIDAAHQQVLADSIKKIETALGPGLSNIPLSPTMKTSQYDFGPITSGSGVSVAGGTINPGGNVLTFATVPAGVSGIDASHPLYISNGTGTPETCLISGGGGTPGEVNGQILVTCSNTHSGAWTIESASDGLAEALYACGTRTCDVFVDAPVTVRATIYAVGSGHAVQIRGVGPATNVITRAVAFTNGDLFKNDHTSCSWKFRDLGISQNGGIVQTGAAINFDHPTVGQYIDSVSVVNGQYGVRSQGTTYMSVNQLYFTQVDNTFQPIAGLEITGSTNTYIANSTIGATQGSFSNMLLYGLYIHSETGVPVDGVWVSNSGFSGQTPINIISNGGGGAFLTLMQFTGIQVDGAKNAGVLIGGNQGICSSIQFTGAHINLQGQNGWPAAAAGVDIGFSSPTVCDDIEFIGGYISGSNNYGVMIGRTGAKAISFRGVDIRDNNRGNNSGVGGLWTANGVTGLTVTGSRIYNQGVGVGHQKYGIVTAGTLIDSIISGNNLLNNETGAVNLGGAISTSIIKDNVGLDDVMTTVLASASTITLDAHSYFQISGATQINTINGGWPGRAVDFMFIDGSPGGFGTGGNIYYAKTATTNRRFQCRYDGTGWSCVGP